MIFFVITVGTFPSRHTHKINSFKDDKSKQKKNKINCAGDKKPKLL